MLRCEDCQVAKRAPQAAFHLHHQCHLHSHTHITRITTAGVSGHICPHCVCVCVCVWACLRPWNNYISSLVISMCLVCLRLFFTLHYTHLVRPCVCVCILSLPLTVVLDHSQPEEKKTSVCVCERCLRCIGLLKNMVVISALAASRDVLCVCVCVSILWIAALVSALTASSALAQRKSTVFA